MKLKSVAFGLFNFLPPDLRRTGRELVNNAKNRIP